MLHKHNKVKIFVFLTVLLWPLNPVILLDLYNVLLNKFIQRLK